MLTLYIGCVKLAVANSEPKGKAVASIKYIFLSK